jgi:hypothetical protein
VGLISDDIRKTAADAIDALMAPAEEGGLGKHCKLVFDPKKTRCPNCFWDAANNRSANHYRPGGPLPFPNGGLCPVCMGKGFTETEVSRPLVLLCNWNPKTWLALPGVNPSTVNLEVPGGAVQTKGMATDLQAVLQSRKLVLDTPLEGVRRYLFTLAGEPFSPGNIIQGRYFYAVWTRAGG